MGAKEDKIRSLELEKEKLQIQEEEAKSKAATMIESEGAEEIAEEAQIESSEILGEQVKSEGERIAEDPLGAAEAAGRGALAGVTLDFDDEAGGGFLALQAQMQGDVRDYGVIYREKRDEIRKGKHKSFEDFPVTSFAGQLAGGVAFGTAASVASPLGRFGTGMGEGIATGVGLSEAELSDGSEASSVLFDGGIGGIVGLAIQGAGLARRKLIPTKIQGQPAGTVLRGQLLGAVKRDFTEDFGNPKDVAKYMHFDLGGFTTKDVVFDPIQVKFVPRTISDKVSAGVMQEEASFGKFYKRNEEAIGIAADARDEILAAASASSDEAALVAEKAITKGESDMFITRADFDPREETRRFLKESINFDLDAELSSGNIKLFEQPDGSMKIGGLAKTMKGKREVQEFVDMGLPSIPPNRIVQRIEKEVLDMSRLRGQSEFDTIQKSAQELYEAFLKEVDKDGGTHLTDIGKIKTNLQRNVKDFSDGLEGIVDSARSSKKRVWNILSQEVKGFEAAAVFDKLGATEATRFNKLNRSMHNMYQANNYLSLAMQPKSALAAKLQFTPFSSKLGLGLKALSNISEEAAINVRQSQAYWADLLNRFKGAGVFKIPGTSLNVWEARTSVYTKLALTNPEVAGWFEKNVLNEDKEAAIGKIGQMFPQLAEAPETSMEFESSMIAFDGIVNEPIKQGMIIQNIHKNKSLTLVERMEMVDEFNRTKKLPEG